MKIRLDPQEFGDIVVCFLLDRMLKGPMIGQTEEYTDLIENLNSKKSTLMRYYLKINHSARQQFKYIRDVFNSKTQTSEHIEIRQRDTLNIRLKSVTGPDGKPLGVPLNVYIKSLKGPDGKPLGRDLNKFLKAIKDSDGKVLSKSLNKQLKDVKGPDGKSLPVPLNVWLKSVKDSNGELLDASLNIAIKTLKEEENLEKAIRKTIEKTGKTILNEDKFNIFKDKIIDEIFMEDE